MAYPPPVPSGPRINTTPQVDTHPADHVAIHAALTDIINILGNDPAGDFASLTARLGGGSDFGIPLLWTGSAIPSWATLCDGGELSRAANPLLFAAIGTTWGVGDGTTTFNKPDLRNTFIVGQGDETWCDTLGESGGSKDAAVVSHNHTNNHDHAAFNTATGGAHIHTSRYLDTGGAGGPNTYARPDNAGFPADRVLNSTPSGGGGHQHSIDVPAYTGTTSTTGVAATNANLPPYTALPYILRLG